MFLCDVDSSVGLTSMKPFASNAKFVDSRNHLAAPACVHQMHSSAETTRPLSSVNFPCSAVTTPSPSMTSTPDSAKIFRNVLRTRLACDGINVPRVTSVNLAKFSSMPRRFNSSRVRCRIESASSAPPAPPPTITTSQCFPDSITRRSIASHRALNPHIGFTGVANASAPRTSPARGAMPTSTLATSNRTPGLPLFTITRPSS
mmetsp:Transcript_5298/g.20646  ORF Transcript_5298/g.20646 Transcript_5298/m.20646 type:complete len:203 (+) Transcript_5298:727-1335(+)